jgi:2-oxoglutarate dehydrogenase E2 component (dihydrolipoamide succinyltransferase)
MAIDVKVPEVGESITEGTLARWLKKDGDTVREGDPIFELETDKATGEVPSPASGRLRIKMKEGQTVQIGAVVGSIEDGAAAPSAPAQPKAEPTTPPRADGRKPEAEPATQPKPELPTEPQPIAPPKAAPPPAPAPSPGERNLPEARPAPPGAYAPGSPGIARESRKPMSRIRRTIGERLVAAQHTAAILTTFNECDMSQVLAIRAQYKESFKERHGVGLGFMSFFIKASVEALKAFPVVNARIDGNDMVEQHFYDIGVAVSTDRGLMAPVIRDADRLRFAELEQVIETFATKAREGKITVEDLQGGTFTITNGGVFGSLLSTPILNPPQSGILGMHTIQKRPIVVNDEVVVRPMMYLALSYDHRLIDGREAVQFLVKVKECIENPLLLLWGL